MRRASLALVLFALAACSSEQPREAATARFPASLQVSLELDELFDLSVERNTNLFTETYAEYVYVDGKMHATPRETWASASPCYYVGRQGDVRVSLKTCGDTAGVAFVDDQAWELRLEDDVWIGERAAPNGACGVQDRPGLMLPVASPMTPTPDVALEHSDDFSTQRLALESTPNFVEMLVVRDVEMQRLANEGYNAPDPAFAVNTAAVLWDGTPLDRRVFPILTGRLDVMGSDPWGAPTFYGNEIAPGSYLDDFNAWMHRNRGSVPDYDEATLLTGWDPTGATVGLANVSGACNTELAGALVFGLGSNASVSQTLAHELGHTLGMWHDGSSNGCDPEAYVMTAIYDPDGPYPTDFSSCSIIDGNAFLASSSAWCITPQSAPAHPEPQCGDGLVEGDEECDCGPDGCSGIDPCCVQSTCRLAEGAACSALDPCCDGSTCEPVSADAQVVCREARDGACDLPEVCDGTGVCPADQVVATGTLCNDGTWNGACYRGTCVTRGATCEALSDSYYFDDPPYAEMCGTDAACGPMECLAEGACVYTQSPPPDGIVCGDGSQCLAGECVPSNTLPGADGCYQSGDADSDGTPDCVDLCPTDPDKIEPGICGCGQGDSCEDPLDPELEDPMPDDPADDDMNDEPGVNIERVDSGKNEGCSHVGAPPLLISILAFLGLRRR